MTQYTIVGIVVAIAVGYALHYVYRTVASHRNPCEGCDGCPLSQQKTDHYNHFSNGKPCEKCSRCSK